MSTVEGKRGSAPLGWMFLASVFGPMVLLAVAWAVVGALGSSAGDVHDARTAVMDVMVMVLLVAGGVLFCETLVLVVTSLARRR